jgi:energy-coupling factor transporter ATP-binding protein EcfA2
MFRKLTLTDFKSFASCELEFGPATVVIGANGTGKSNLREALKLLHAIARGYSLSEIFIERSNNGVREWDGIRGGVGHAAREEKTGFKLSLECDLTVDLSRPLIARYEIAVQTQPSALFILGERLVELVGSKEQPLYATHWDGEFPTTSQQGTFRVDIRPGGKQKKARSLQLAAHQPVLLQIAKEIDSRDWRDAPAQHVKYSIELLSASLGHIRFLDVEPRQMRQPSAPLQDILSENGSNLAGVLQKLHGTDNSGALLASWVTALTPIAASAFKFDYNSEGRIVASLVTTSGRTVPLSVASDGTLRFLAMLAAAYGPKPASLLCIEEAETGLHPVRLQLLADLLRRQTQDPNKGFQALFTTHAPALLRGLGDAGIEHGYLAVKSTFSDGTQLRPLKSIPDIRAIVATPGNDLGNLLEAGWFESTTAMEVEPARIEFEQLNEEGTGQ